MFILLRAPNCAATIWGWRLIEEIRYMHYPRDSLLHVVGTGMVGLVSLSPEVVLQDTYRCFGSPSNSFLPFLGTTLHKERSHHSWYHPDDICTYTCPSLSCTLPIPSLYQYTCINPIPHWPYFDPPNQSKNISPAWIEPWASSAEESKVGEK